MNRNQLLSFYICTILPEPSMRKHAFYLSLLIFIFLHGRASGQSETSAQGTDSIDTTILKTHIQYLASEALGGRATGANTLDTAAKYIHEQFLQAGLKPFTSMFNYFYLIRDTVLPKLKIDTGKYIFGWDYYTSFSGKKRSVRASEIVWVNDRVEEWKIPGGSLYNKVLIVIPGLLNDQDSSINLLNEWVSSAEKFKAKAIIIPSYKFFGRENMRGINAINSRLSTDAADAEIPIIFVHWGIINNLLGLNTLDSVLNHRYSIDLSRYNKRVRFDLKFQDEKIGKVAYNIAGYVEGKEKNEFIVIGAHYDHVGKKGNHIYYGADDNASGTAALMELARLFGTASRSGWIPERSILFVAFSAEELGLLGSRQFLRYFPASDTIRAMINMDMIGRRDGRSQKKDYLFVVGYDFFPNVWKSLLEKTEDEFPDLKADYSISKYNDPEEIIYRSDQYPFLQRNIPVLFFTDGMRSDYHLPTDTWDKIDYELLKKRTQYIFFIIRQLSEKKGNICDCD